MLPLLSLFSTRTTQTGPPNLMPQELRQPGLPSLQVRGGLLSPKVILDALTAAPEVIEGTAVHAEDPTARMGGHTQTSLSKWRGSRQPPLLTAVCHSAGCTQATNGQPHSLQTEPQQQGYAREVW